MTRLHDDELPVDVDLVRRLLDAHFPEYADVPLSPLGDSGSSNALFRLGDDALVRVPRQPGGGAGIVKEAAWLPYVADRVIVRTPRVLGLGGPTSSYPERWSVTTWLPGVRPAPPTPGERPRTRLATDLVRFVTELRAMEVPVGARDDGDLRWYRGGGLAVLDDDLRAAVEDCRPLDLDLDLGAVVRVWDEAVAASRSLPRRHTWFHGDLLAENLLVGPDGGLAAVLDFGGLALGDPTVDLVVAWEVLDPAGREVLRRGLEVDDATWAVSRGWAVLIALITFPYYGSTMPRRCSDRLAMVRAVID